MKKLISRFMILAVVSLGCGGATEFEEDAPLKEPIKNKDIKEVIGFKKAITEIPLTKVIGGLYKSLFKVLVKEYYAAEIVNEKYQSNYEDVISRELSKANYNCVSQKVIFDTSRIEPRFLLGAIVTDARLNSYLITSESELVTYQNNADALLNIRWELYDAQEKKIIYSHSELGTSRDQESDVMAYRQSVRVSFRNFLAEKELVETLRNYVKNYPARSN